MEIFSKRLKAERERKKSTDSKWTQGYVADVIGVARPTYTAYENGTKQPPLETLNRIADLFDVSLDYLQGRSVSRVTSGGSAYLDGGKDWTDEEKAVADAAIQAWREMKKKQREEEG
ncbi:helix-turn-helix domain-containing protein [Paenibacillus sp. JX-17]|uniref:Helix-turn-helix domain-containing protein n=1 Tax=Paenibacillus lacisoli TaxID=3064525 RepID=A0ABT9CKP2_9BACL|nr:helix-turn-helix domain-containing protein [Paenibacillus sp. JX-17]MDO7908472.1 helix-turn-helix domain-containing protein [Paenibacillus sp. JX-17]